MLSIIVPVYNTEKYLAKCLDSIIQALEKVEIKTEVLVINDGSIDNSKIVIEKYKNEHPIKPIIKQEEHFISNSFNFPTIQRTNTPNTK